MKTLIGCLLLFVGVLVPRAEGNEGWVTNTVTLTELDFGPNGEARQAVQGTLLENATRGDVRAVSGKDYVIVQIKDSKSGALLFTGALTSKRRYVTPPGEASMLYLVVDRVRGKPNEFICGTEFVTEKIK